MDAQGCIVGTCGRWWVRCTLKGRLCPNPEALLLTPLWPNLTLTTKCSQMDCDEFPNGSMDKLGANYSTIEIATKYIFFVTEYESWFI